MSWFENFVETQQSILDDVSARLKRPLNLLESMQPLDCLDMLGQIDPSTHAAIDKAYSGHLSQLMPEVGYISWLGLAGRDDESRVEKIVFLGHQHQPLFAFMPQNVIGQFAEIDRGYFARLLSVDLNEIADDLTERKSEKAETLLDEPLYLACRHANFKVLLGFERGTVAVSRAIP